MIGSIENKLESKYHWLLLIVIILFVLLQSLFLATKTNYYEDEEFSYIAATGKWGEFVSIMNNRKYPFGEAVDISVYKDFFKIDKKFCFGRIARDVSSLDVSPPLYYWLLHVWMLITGGSVNLWTGNILNIILGMFIILILFMIAFKLFNSFEDALFSTIIFSLCPAFYGSNVDRPYYLLTLISLLYVYYFLKLLMKEGKKELSNVILSSLFISLGLLTHYNFFYICFALFIFLVKNYFKQNRPLVYFFTTSCLMGFLFFCNIFPGFVGNLLKFHNSLLGNYLPGTPEAHSLLDLRVSTIMTHRLGVFFSAHQKSLINFLLGLGQIFYYISLLGIGLVYLFIRFTMKKNIKFQFIFALAFYPLIIMSLLYICKKALPTSYQDKYHLFIYPFLILSMVFLLKTKLINYKKIILVCLCQILFFSTVDNLIVLNIRANNTSKRVVAFSEWLKENKKDWFWLKEGKEEYDYIILGCPTAYRAFKFIRILPETAKVIIADPLYLFKNYAVYFNEKSKFLPFVYIDHLYNFGQKNTLNYILVKQLAGDKNIKITRFPFFDDITGYEEIILKLDKNHKK